jgi:uncharacterized cupredoxin-like copper-binding protein
MVLAISVSGCALHGSTTQGDPASAPAVHVTERDFRISAPSQIQPGDVLLSVRNRGPDNHELLVVRADGPLPLRRDGSTVDEEAIEPSLAGVLEAGEPNSVRVLKVHLLPGRYKFICNMSGHYLGGMDAEFVVE